MGPFAPVLHSMGYLWQNGGVGMAADIIITGGRPLNGTVEIPAAKNSVLPLLAASLLCYGTVRLQGVPLLADVQDCLTLLNETGRIALRQGMDIVVEGVPCRWELAAEQAARMRASILFCAPLLARLGRAQTVLPGGCRIGARPIDLHLEGLEQMGVRTRQNGEKLELYAPAGLHGAQISLRFASVGATETLLLAAATAQGETVIYNAAREPEIVDLAQFIVKCGGCVQGAGTGTIWVWGRRFLTGCSHRPVADRIVASTLACACAAAGGNVELVGCAPELYTPVLELLARMGCRVDSAAQRVRVARFGRLQGVGKICTGVYPGIATDAAPLLAAALLCAEGNSAIEDTVFENRFACAKGFAALGADTAVEGRTLQISGAKRLRGTLLSAPDLRGGAALVTAALAANGTSRITHTEYIDRGYADLAGTLAVLGAQISREIMPMKATNKKRPSKKQNYLAIGAKR